MQKESMRSLLASSIDVPNNIARKIKDVKVVNGLNSVLDIKKSCSSVNLDG
jgi:hypothetical protein